MTLKIAILDSLADDFEGLEQIEKYLSFLGYKIQKNEIGNIIKQLLNENLIYVVEDISDDEYIWYGLTKKGKALWNESETAGVKETGRETAETGKTEWGKTGDGSMSC